MSSTHRFENYSGSIAQCARAIRRPASMAELLELVCSHDRDRSGGLTLRGPGNSLHDQALGEGTVLLLDRLPHEILVIVDDVSPPAGHSAPGPWSSLEVTAWTPWDCIVRATLALEQPAGWNTPERPGVWRVHGERGGARPIGGNWAQVIHAGTRPRPLLVPYSFVSSGRITPAGSLSADALWRFSAVLGRESDAVVWFDLLTASGTVRRLHNPRLRPSPAVTDDSGSTPSRAEDDELFHAAIGGFGLLGVIVRVKYVLLELVPNLRWTDIPDLHGRLPCAGDRLLRPRRRLPRYMSAIERVADAVLKATERPPWPVYPHSGGEQLGRLGKDLPVQVLTWMQEMRDVGELADALARAWRQAIDAHATTRLPRYTSADTRGRFALVFLNGRQPRAVLAQVAYGVGDARLPRLKLWDRAFTWMSTARLLRYRLLPWAARLGERLAYWGVFEACMRGVPTANAIPEFGFFLEGHSVALAGRREPPHTLQQAWTIPFEVDQAGRCTRGRDELVAFVAALHALSRRSLRRRGAIRAQVCDIKISPPSAAVLSSSKGGAAFMVTATLENTRAYPRQAGSPADALSELTTIVHAAGGKLHLAKGLHARAETLHAMYGAAFGAFQRLKARFDPSDLWYSNFAQRMQSDRDAPLKLNDHNPWGHRKARQPRSFAR